MKGYEPRMSFGEEVAERYDHVAERGDEPGTVTFLESLAHGGPALELAIGTGRIALRLAAGGMRVDGIDFAPAMVEQLRAKRGGDQIAVTIGDFADVPVSGTYPLIFLVANTLSNLLTQEDQVRCFENVAAHLSDDGSFVVEGGVMTLPFLTDLINDQYVQVEGLGIDRVALDVLRHDPATQTLEENHIVLSAEGIRFGPIVTRYTWPSEMDLMARIAGLCLRERWGGWTREPFTSSSRNCISVYGH